jgi:hypothetical protein
MIGIGWLIAMTCVVIGNVFWYRMLSEVNGRLNPDQRFSTLLWYPNKSIRLWRSHKELFPDSQLRKREVAVGIVMFGSFLVIAGALLSQSAAHAR